MRGKETTKSEASTRRRITPACAGKSGSDETERCGIKDHPRVCGEKPTTIPSAFVVAESPPRVRGKAGKRPGGFELFRITPACAGKSFYDTT